MFKLSTPSSGKVYKLVTPATGLVISVADLKPRIGIFHAEKDVALQSYIEAATELAERFTGRQLLAATWELQLPYWQFEVLLKHFPVTSLTSIKYYDINNVDITIDLNDSDTVVYTIDVEQPVIWLRKTLSVFERPDAIRIRFASGYATGTIPRGIINAICLIAGALYQNPIDSVENLPKASINLLRNYRI